MTIYETEGDVQVYFYGTHEGNLRTYFADRLGQEEWGVAIFRTHEKPHLAYYSETYRSEKWQEIYG